MDHDDCIKTRHYVHVGQNLAKICDTPDYRDLEQAIRDAMHGWFIEYKDLPPEWLKT